MEISNKDKKLLVYMLAISIIAGVYFFFARPLMDKQDALNTEVEQLKASVNHYSEIYSRQGEYEQQIADAQARYDMEIASFGNNLAQENTIMMLKEIEQNTGVWITKVSFQDPEVMSGGTSENPAEDGVEETSTDSTYIVRKQALNIDYSIDYSKLKHFLEYINDYDRQLYISSINMGYSVESNIVSGTLTLNQYEMNASGEEPEKPDLSGITVGKDNVFLNYKFSDEDMGLTLGTLENTESSEEISEDGEQLDESEEVSDSADGRRPNPETEEQDNESDDSGESEEDETGSDSASRRAR